MAQTFIDKFDPLKTVSFSSRLFNWRLVISILSLFFITVLIWVLTTPHITDLGSGKNLVSSGLVEQWKRGDVVVMIRHAERCDRSASTCLGSADGITVNGSHAASDVGTGLKRLGLERAHMIASPLTRTQQTANYIAGQAVVPQDWAAQCNSHFKDEVITHKTKGENMILVTHSGCIDHFERAMGVSAGERSSNYAEAFFVRMDGRSSPKILGALNAGQWKNLASEQSQ